MACRKVRPYRQIMGAVCPNYQKEDKHVNNPPSPVHKEGVEWAKKNGILTGDAAGGLKLTEPATRQRLRTMLFRFAKMIGKSKQGGCEFASMRQYQLTEVECENFRHGCNFTDDERAIFDLRVKGKSRAEIAASMAISIATTDQRLRCIHEKVNKVKEPGS